MASLTTRPNFERADDFYAKLIAAHEGLSDDESMALNARLILTLANHVGDQQALEEALRIARPRRPA
ncbi:DUF2783 domain-containing protein [Amaricoccus sp. W119]|uniref:DUF2783 domain-containing protein n=1 Tax=Amaricoccus sp. W119 TaxID=3391833 RepID=UPI0039A7331D